MDGNRMCARGEFHSSRTLYYHYTHDSSRTLHYHYIHARTRTRAHTHIYYRPRIERSNEPNPSTQSTPTHLLSLRIWVVGEAKNDWAAVAETREKEETLAKEEAAAKLAAAVAVRLGWYGISFSHGLFQAVKLSYLL